MSSCYITSHGKLVEKEEFIPMDPQLVCDDTGSTQGAGVFPYDLLPPELRLKIFRLIFKSSVPVYPSVLEVIDENRPRQARALSRRAALPQKLFLIANKPWLAPRRVWDALEDSFRFKRFSVPTGMLLLNRQLSVEAMAVLWGDNTIVLQFPLEWKRDVVSHDASLFPRSLTFIPGQETLPFVRKLVIEVYLSRGSMLNSTAVRFGEVNAELEMLVAKIGSSHHLRHLEVRFTNLKLNHNPNEVLFDFNSKKHGSQLSGSYSDFMRYACCKRTNDIVRGQNQTEWMNSKEIACKKSARVDEQALKPLADLRGIPNVTFAGMISPDWAEYLATCMKGTNGDVFPEFQG